jgi:hypothetical protein
LGKQPAMYTYDTLSEAVNGLKARGYTEDFNLKGHCLECAPRNLQLHPEDFNVDEFYRFEGASNPDDNSIVYAISSNEGLKGVLVDAYGMYSENINDAMARKLR